jgi:CRISPR-associated protein Csm4
MSYSLLERGGWVSSSNPGHQVRRKKVRMLGEGSVFKGEPIGQLADVRPYKEFPHPVYRSGISLTLPIVIGNET